jgi:hypothetical protein
MALVGRQPLVDPNQELYQQEKQTHDRPSEDESTKKTKKDLEAQNGLRADSSDSGLGVGAQLEMEKDNAIQYRTCSWQKTAFLMFSEYICLAIMSFPWS